MMIMFIVMIVVLAVILNDDNGYNDVIVDNKLNLC